MGTGKESKTKKSYLGKEQAGCSIRNPGGVDSFKTTPPIPYPHTLTPAHSSREFFSSFSENKNS